MCSFCAGGMADPDLVLPTNDGTTCTTASDYASTLPASDIICGTVLMAEAFCCPPAAAVVDPAPTTAAPPVDATAAPTIYDLGASDPNFSILVSLVDAAGLAEVVQGPGPLTLFGE